MKRLLPLAAFLVASLLLGACADSESTSVGSPPAAEVNGAAISEDDLLGQLEAAATIEGYGAGVLGLQSTVTGEAEGTYSTDASAEVLTTLVVFELMQQELEELDIEVTDDDRAAVEDQVAQSLGVDPATGQPDPEAGASRLDELSDDQRRVMVDGLAAASVLGEELTADVEADEVTDEDVRAAYDENPDVYAAEEVCTRHILVAAGDPQSGVEATEEEVEQARTDAEEILAELEGGADFETVAQEQSDDTASGAEGGDLGCNAQGAFVPEFEDAAWALEVGERSDLVQSDFGFHIIEVYDRRTPTFEDVQEDIRAQLESEAQTAVQEESQVLFQEWYSEALTGAEVTVDPRYGTWQFFALDPATSTEVTVDDAADAQFARVVPPGGPTTTTVASLPAIEPSLPVETE